MLWWYKYSLWGHTGFQMNPPLSSLFLACGVCLTASTLGTGPNRWPSITPLIALICTWWSVVYASPFLPPPRPPAVPQWDAGMLSVEDTVGIGVLSMAYCSGSHSPFLVFSTDLTQVGSVECVGLFLIIVWLSQEMNTLWMNLLQIYLWSLLSVTQLTFLSLICWKKEFINLEWSF